MAKDHTVVDAVYEATHRLPGTPPHQDHPAGHQGSTGHGQSFQDGAHHGSVPAHDRPRRMLVGWQNWIAGRFSRTTD